jgi:methylthioribulose-1-phosphate dehydratase
MKPPALIGINLEDRIPWAMRQTSATRTAEAKEPSAFCQLARQLARAGRDFRNRGWALGTSGNFSAVVSVEPFRLAITQTGIDKQALTEREVILVDDQGRSLNGLRRPSEETALHLTIVRVKRAGAVLHTHSVWSTLVSEHCAERGGIHIEGYEMLKGLQGVRTHQHREWLPILENSQDMKALAASIEDTLAQHRDCHGFLLRRHGLYTWGQDLVQAKRHVEILEFLLEVVGRKLGGMAEAPN